MDKILKHTDPSAMDATSKEQEQQEHQLTNTNTSIDNVTLADFTASAGAVPTPLFPQQYPSSLQVTTGKQKAVEETLEPDKAAQKQEKIIKNRESAKSRESKKVLEEKVQLDTAALPKQKGTAKRREYNASYREKKKARVTELVNTAKDLEIELERLSVQIHATGISVAERSSLNGLELSTIF
ncbi:hypothetical protein TSUD_83820 [Trifolium subterraneum]|uniref:BZIP domain-containing protein n=1 Tax=Trifolium subterraneum TaxID=3900 RepID=A0A2Z6N4Q7_TRISU|nr:hypothetical protein TSUD_83820 [Trifolium subterraneum]